MTVLALGGGLETSIISILYIRNQLLAETATRSNASNPPKDVPGTPRDPPGTRGDPPGLPGTPRHPQNPQGHLKNRPETFTDPQRHPGTCQPPRRPAKNGSLEVVWGAGRCLGVLGVLQASPSDPRGLPKGSSGTYFHSTSNPYADYMAPF